MRIVEAFVFSNYFEMPPRSDIYAVRMWIKYLLDTDLFLHAEMVQVGTFISD